MPHGITPNNLLAPSMAVYRPLAESPGAVVGLLLIDQAGIEIGINRHLFARHGIEGKTRRHFCNTPGTLGDDTKLITTRMLNTITPTTSTADDKVPKGFDDLSGGLPPIAMQQDQRGGDV